MCAITEDEDPGTYYQDAVEPAMSEEHGDIGPGPLTDDSPLVQQGMETELERFKSFDCYEVVAEEQVMQMENPIEAKSALGEDMEARRE